MKKNFLILAALTLTFQMFGQYQIRIENRSSNITNFYADLYNDTSSSITVTIEFDLYANYGIGYIPNEMNAIGYRVGSSITTWLVSGIVPISYFSSSITASIPPGGPTIINLSVLHDLGVQNRPGTYWRAIGRLKIGSIYIGDVGGSQYYY